MKLLINLNGKSEKFNSKLMYCLTCQQIKTQSSVTFEICSYYCPHCLDKVNSSEVSSNMGNCRKCFLCPTCECCLAVIAFNQDNKEVYYFKCNYCKWDSLHSEEKIAGDSPEFLFRTAIMLDQDKNENFRVKLEEFESKINKLKKEEDQNNMPKFHTHLFGKKNLQKDLLNKSTSISSNKEKYTMGQMQERLEQSEKEICPKPSNHKSTGGNKKEDIEQYLQQHSVIELDKESYDYHIEELGKKKAKTHPLRQKLFSKCSVRCLECDKLLIRPELGDSVSFQRLHLAIKYLPNIFAINLKDSPFVASKPNSITFSLLNPLSCEVNVSISDLSPCFSFSGENASNPSLSLTLKPNSSLFFPQKSSSQLVPFVVDYNPTEEQQSSSLNFQLHIEYTGSVEKHQKTVLSLTLNLE